MPSTTYDAITHQTLAQKLRDRSLNNHDRTQGMALVNVLEPKSFQKEHIPGSINIPRGQEHEFETRFDKDKEIVVYCASTDCDASPKTAEALSRRGFNNVYDYEAGMKGWNEAEKAQNKEAS